MTIGNGIIDIDIEKFFYKKANDDLKKNLWVLIRQIQ